MHNQKKIAFFSSHINNSLQWFWYQRALNNIIPDAIHIIINIGKEEPLLAKDLRAIGLTVYILPHNNIFDHIKNVIKATILLKKHKINLVHTTLPFGNLIGQSAAIICCIKSRITTCENASWAHDFKNKKQALIDKFTYFFSKKIIATSNSARAYLENNWKIKKGKLVTIYHGLEDKEYENISKERIDKLRHFINIQDKQFVVGMIARLEFWKGHQYAIEAMQIVKAKGYPIKLHIFGANGPDFQKIHAQINSSELQDTVFYHGFVDDPVALFKLFNIHLHVPINLHVENGGINIIEGMISSTPQILTLSGYSAQSAVHMQNAFVVDYCSSSQIAEAIMYLYDNPETAKKLGDNARLDALNQYSNKIKVKKHIALYNTL